MRTTSIALAVMAWATFLGMVEAKSFPALIDNVTPCAVQAGKTVDCEVTASYSLFDASTVVVSGEGVTGEIVPEPLKPGEKPPPTDARGTQVKVRFKAAADAVPGMRDFRMLTPRGPSSLGQLVVVRDPVVREATTLHPSLETAQPVTLPAAINGAISSREDVDFYKFRVSAGTALTFHMYCQRLMQQMTPLSSHADPMMTLRNATGTILAANDNFFSADPLLHYQFTTAGDYYLEVRDVRYAGQRYWHYVIEAHDRPFVLQTVPAAIPPGATTRVRLLGFNAPADPVALTIPADSPDGVFWATSPPVQGRPLEAVPVLVSRLPGVAEAAAPNDMPTHAQPLTLPAIVSGIIEKPDDIDHYAFDAKKGERLTFIVSAKSLHSELDSYLRILNPKGEVLAENDDTSDKTEYSYNRNEFVVPDSRIESWEVPTDGRYFIEIRDTHQRGGERFTYAMQVRPSRPHFTLDLDSDKTALAPGYYGVIFARAFRREGFTGDVQLSIEGLPDGVAATCGRVPIGGSDGCILLKAAPDAPRKWANIRVIGTATVTGPTGKPDKFSAVARPMQELMVDGGGRFISPVRMHTFQVVDALDLKAVSISPKEVTLKPGGTATVEVTIKRSPGFAEPVSLFGVHYQHVWTYGNCLPAGVAVDVDASRTRLVGNQLKGTLVLKAAADAKPIEKQLVPMMATVAINFPLKMIYSGEPFYVTVAPGR